MPITNTQEIYIVDATKEENDAEKGVERAEANVEIKNDIGNGDVTSENGT